MSRVVVVAPHPDDEVLGCAALLSGATATVIHVTNGVPPWIEGTQRAALGATRQAECARAWEALSSEVDALQLGLDDLVAWRHVEEIASALSSIVGGLGTTEVYVPAYQMGHPDHDATYLAACLAMRQLCDRSESVWRAYGLYGFDQRRVLRFGWLAPEAYGPIDERRTLKLLRLKADALRRFPSQTWSGSLLDQWLDAPAGEQFSPLPTIRDRRPDLPCFYDTQRDFARFGASSLAVEAVLRPFWA
jgi:LmbE family N-acetylglucosaminyl deacetylase